MSALVYQSEKGFDVTSSLKIAEKFGKMHKNVLADIETLECSPEFNRLNFQPIDYTDSRNRSQRAYEITKDGFSFLVMGYTGAKAAEFKETFIAEFNKRTDLLTNEDYIIHQALAILNKKAQALEEKAKQLESANSQLETTIKEQAPMVVHYNKVLSAGNSHLATAIAQVFELGVVTFNRLLDEWGIQRRVGAEWVLCAKYLGNGYTITRPVPYLNSQNIQQTKNELRWTEKGREFLVKEFEKRGYKAVA